MIKIVMYKLILTIVVTVCYFIFPTIVTAAITTVNSWDNVTASSNTDIQFVLTQNDFPSGSNFASSEIDFYLGDIKSIDSNKADFYSMSGVQGFWDTQPYHVNKWNSDYGQGLTGEQILDRHFEMISNSGIRWIRMDWDWNNIYSGELNQCSNDSFYSYTTSDLIFRLASKHQLHILANLFVTPRKLSSCIGNSEFCSWNEGYPWYPPKDLYSNNCQGGCGSLNSAGSPCFNDFINRVVNRYRPGGEYHQNHPEIDIDYGITHWEIWNEPDHGVFWLPQDGEIYESYYFLLRGAYQTISDIRTNTGENLKVLFGGLALPELKLSNYYSKVGSDLNSYFDIMSIHRYDDPRSAGSGTLSTALQQTRNILNNHGATDKSIWITEAGGKYTNYQTDYITNTLDQLYMSRSNYNLEKIFWWPSKDYYLYSDKFDSYLDGSNTDWNANAGLIKNFYRPKDAYLILAQEIAIQNWITYSHNLNPDNSLAFTIPHTDLQNDHTYILFYSVNNKISTGKTIKLTIDDNSVNIEDINQDGWVDFLDINILVSAFNTFKVEADLNGSGSVDIYDFTSVVSYYGN